ncbi:MAG: aminotransferase class V-fold PLP-dependent enzyme [Gemmatimonadetes bacterium]|nr:aminotransferase class V-fold PLP-dependent enzyme [Gemmatimonadota bacterium]
MKLLRDARHPVEPSGGASSQWARGGVTFVVDAIQGLGVVPFSVAESQADIVACGAQKWLLSPWGTGFVWIRRALLRTMDPNPVGWMAPEGTDDFSKMLDYSLDWRDNARRFEVISLPFQDFVGFNASVGLLLEVGIERVHAHVEAVVSAGIAAARERGLRVVTPEEPSRRAGVLGVVPRGDAGAASKRLLAAGVTHSIREGSVRLSPHLFSSEDDLRAAVALLGSSTHGAA